MEVAAGNSNGRFSSTKFIFRFHNRNDEFDKMDSCLLFLLCVCSWEKEYWLVHYNLLWDWLEKKLSLRIRRRTAAAAVKGDMFRTGQRVIHPKEEKCSINLGQTRTHKVCTEHQPPSSWKVDEIWQRLGGSNIKSLPRVTVVLARFLERDAGQRIRPERWGET